MLRAASCTNRRLADRNGHQVPYGPHTTYAVTDQAVPPVRAWIAVAVHPVGGAVPTGAVPCSATSELFGFTMFTMPPPPTAIRPLGQFAVAVATALFAGTAFTVAVTTVVPVRPLTPAGPCGPAGP